jgi:ubiquinone/menaquinone biosynthesis C-methylase UbiE
METVDEAKRLKDIYGKRGLNPYRAEAIRKFAGRTILDVGCGNGAYVLAFADEYEIRGVDRQPFESWSPRPERFGISEAARLDLPDSHVETILSFETLEHLPDPLAALKEYRRVFSKNVILTVPNCEITEGMRQSNLLYSHWADRTHVNFFDMQSIAALVREAGFTVEESYYVNKASLLPFLREAFGVKGAMARIARSIVGRVQPRPYFITSLVVAGKPARSAPDSFH